MHWRRDGTPLSRSLGTNNNICLYIYTTSKTYYHRVDQDILRFLIFRPIMTTDGEDPVKCPCCDNPWSRGAGDMYAQLCAMCEETKEDGGEVVPPPPALSRANLDETVSPTENFYQHANGGWVRANPIPKGYPSWNSFLQLHTQSQEQLRDLLLELGGVGEGPAATEDERKVAAYYRAAMDEEAIEEAGLGPMGPLLALCDEAASASPGERAALLGRIMAGYGVSAFFGFGAGPDKTDSERSICQIYQGGARPARSGLLLRRGQGGEAGGVQGPRGQDARVAVRGGGGGGDPWTSRGGGRRRRVRPRAPPRRGAHDQD